MVAIDTISSSLRRGEDGIWYGNSEDVSYPPEGNATCLAVEESSFWFRHRNDCIVAAVTGHPPPGDATIFDVGGGNGLVSLALTKAGFDVVLVEPGREGALNAKRRGVETVVCATLEAARFENGTLPACGLFDVIEHVRGDVALVHSIRDLLVPGGRLYATVPAYSFLWSDQDDLAGHFRRYTLRSLAATLQAAGLEVSFSTYFFRFLPVAIFLARTLPYRLGLAKKTIELEAVKREHLVSNEILSRALSRLLASEVGNIRCKRPMVLGGSCLVVATRS